MKTRAVVFSPEARDDLQRHVALGLDPRVHSSICRYEAMVIEVIPAGWIVGSSPTMTGVSVVVP